MKIAICDDVALYNQHLREMLDNYMSRNKVSNYILTEYNCGQTLLEGYSRSFDYVFIDIEMPVIDGFRTAGKIREIDVDTGIVFVTNMKSQMQMGFRYGAKDYLCKPVTQQQIDELMDRLLDEYRHKNSSEFYNIKLKYDEGTARLKLSDIIYFESNDQYILATTAEEAFTFRGRLSIVEEDLKDKGFIRVHRSFLVNAKYVFKNFGNCIVLKSGERISVSRKYRDAVDEVFKGIW
ncbi:MAG: LytTR family DNA-binding domain-containing protein [Defluviitaleaceae bacterium]|nr:LytTR family DNA-binding domain-containing protein [Defluviitaleaceae bacterium]